MDKYTNRTRMLFVALVGAVIWGYFSDLRHGEIGSFIGRIIFMPLFFLLLTPKKTSEGS